jgi:hypothetical protein
VVLGEGPDRGQVAREPRHPERHRRRAGRTTVPLRVRVDPDAEPPVPASQWIVKWVRIASVSRPYPDIAWAFQPSRSTGESASACAIVWGCWACTTPHRPVVGGVVLEGVARRAVRR